MFVIKKYETFVTLFHISGTFQTFKSKADALSKLSARWIQDNVGSKYQPAGRKPGHYKSGWQGFYRECDDPTCQACLKPAIEYIMKDDSGNAVTYDSDFLPLVKRKYLESVSKYKSDYDMWNGTGPVPRTRKWRGGPGSKNYSHLPHYRNSFIFKEEGEVPSRAARGFDYIPNPWGGYDRANFRDKSWKRHRKHQWKSDAISYRGLPFDTYEDFE